MKRLLLVISLAGLFTISSCASVEPARVTAAAQRLQAVFPKWELLPVSSTPDVTVLGHEGYRIILRHTWPEYPVDTLQQRSATSGQQQYRPSPRPAATAKPIQSVTEYQHIECVLFPAPVTEPLAVRDAIPWQDLPQVFYVRPVYAGKGQGFTWFCRTSPREQAQLRQELHLEGGEDSLAILASGLTIQDRYSYTRGTSAYFLAHAGDEALPYIARVIEEHSDNPGTAFTALEGNPSEASTKLLLQYYTSNNEALSRRAEVALASRGRYRASAKEAYLNMLKGRRRVAAASEASVQFGWTEAIPLLQAICAKPDSVLQYQQAFEARRTLEGNPVPKELKDAQDTIRRAAFQPVASVDVDKVRQAKEALVSSQDREAVMVIATWLWTVRSMGGRDQWTRQTGLEILQQLPRQQAYDFVRQMAEAIQDQNQHPDLARLEQALAPQQ